MASAPCPRHQPVEIVDEPPLTILFLGDRQVGKTTFIANYCRHIRDNDGILNHGGEYLVFRQSRFHKELQGRNFDILLLDLLDGETVESLVGQLPNTLDAVVLCFAVDDPFSFDRIVNWYYEFLQIARDNTPAGIVPPSHLLGLKQDLRENEEGRLDPLEEPVPLLRALEYHQNMGFGGEYLETSAEIDPEHAIFIMETLIEHVFVYRGLHEPV